MIGAFDVVLACIAGLFGAFFVRLYFSGIGVVRRIQKQPTIRAADVAEGPAEIAGRIRVVGDPLLSLEGAPCAAIKREIARLYRSEGDQARTRDELKTSETTEIEIEDESGTVLLDLDELILLGPKKEYRFEGPTVKAKHPDLWKVVTRDLEGKSATVWDVTVEETILPDGVEGFVSGHASPSDRLAPGGSYRGATRRLKISGEARRPLIAAAWREDQVISFLRAPLRRALVMGFVTWCVGAIAVLIPLAIARYAGL
ncbi:MAG: hypothetical protein U0414_06990 [Polyangiaceae bacterium]